MIDKISGFSFGLGHVPPIVKGTAAATTSGGAVLIAEGIINASTGPIIAGMVTVIGTAVVVVAGQLLGAANKAYAERQAIATKAEAERQVLQAKAEVERRAADLAADTAERAALLHDYLIREAEMRAEIRDLRDKYEAELRKGQANGGSTIDTRSSTSKP